MTRTTPIRSGWAELKKDEKGAAAILAALVMPVFVGGLGMGAETGYWYYTHRKLQHAADVAAHAGATRVRAGDRNLIQTAATDVAQSTGFSTNRGTLVANSPPVSGPSAGQNMFVEVLITETRPRLLTGLFSTAPVVFSTRAVAGVTNEISNGCVLALSRSAPRAIEVSGSTNVKVNGCDVVANSNAVNAFEMVGNSASLSTDCVHTVGEGIESAKLTLTRCASIFENAPPVRDPYETVAEPAVEGPCENGNVRNETITPSYNHSSGVKSVRFCKGFRFQGTVELKPGLYIIDGGDFTSNGNSALKLAAKQGSEPNPGVTIYITNGASLKIAANAEYDLGPSTTGPYQGILFFGSRTSAAAIAADHGDGDVQIRRRDLYAKIPRAV